MFWFWFHLVVNLLMLATDAGWWLAVLRLTRRRLWRVLATIFLAGQMAALLSLMCDLNWMPYAPKAVLVGVLLWHFFGVGAGLAILAPVGIVRAINWMTAAASRIYRLRGSSGAVARASSPDTPAPAGLIPVPAVADARGVSAAKPPASSLTRRGFLGACVALTPPLFTIGSTAVAMAQLNSLRVRRFTMLVPSLPRSLDGTTIAHVSDLHVGRVTSSRVLREMVNITNSLRTDLVLMTGDLINYELSDLSEGIALMKAMSGRYGLWMIEGNHDVLDNGEEFESRVKAAGVPFLLNEFAMTNVRGYPVQLFGLRWVNGGGRSLDRILSIQLREVMRYRQPEAFPILLAHHPHAFDAAAKANIPLTLAGHTHGGQLMLNSQHGVGSAFFRYWSGLYAQGSSQMVVSNGVGNWFPIRVNAPAEIVHITLRCTESKA